MRRCDPNRGALTAELDEGGVVVLTVTGTLDTYAVLKLRETIERRAGEGCVRIICEMSGVSGLNSTAVGILLTASKGLRQKGGDLLLAGLPAEHLDTLSILGALKVLRVFPDVTAAHHSFEG